MTAYPLNVTISGKAPWPWASALGISGGGKVS